MDYRRAKTSDLSIIGPHPGLNFEANKENEQEQKSSASSADGGVGDSNTSSSSSRSRSSSQHQVFVPKKGALKRRDAIRKKQNQLSPKLQRLREKARAEAKKQGIIGSTPEAPDENEEILYSDQTPNDTDRPFSEIRRHALF
uniref:Uncharacterized protein n=1 Tax=Acrobeloides nanus TaxID=290746 RepID=A0A914E0C3_9BILA